MNNRPVRVLIAEDDYFVLEEIKRTLRGQNYEIVGEAYNGESAVKMVNDLHPDVVLMDIKMPKMDGLEASQRIQEQCATPIVVLTAHEPLDLVENASIAGVSAYLNLR
ncbi:MAG: response regulator, partial [Desulfobulbaceae bacterium]|nr:response regulator [Desulfobulbaceae bacterium]